MPISFSAEAKQKIDALRGRYPSAQAACLPVLHLAQEEFGYISDEAIDLVAQALGLPAAHVWGVVTFYTMYHRHPVGRHEPLQSDSRRRPRRLENGRAPGF